MTIGNDESNQVAIIYGVPQEPVNGPLLFSLYMLIMAQILQKLNVNYHSFADDTQIYLALSPDDYSPLVSFCGCFDQVNNWLNQNFLQPNQGKTRNKNRTGLLLVNTSVHCH